MMKFRVLILVMIAGVLIAGPVHAQNFGIIDFLYDRIKALLYLNPVINQVLLQRSNINATSTNALLEVQASSTPAIYANLGIHASSTSQFNGTITWGNASTTGNTYTGGNATTTGQHYFGNRLELKAIDTPTENPASGDVNVYATTTEDGSPELHITNASGLDVNLTGGGGGCTTLDCLSDATVSLFTDGRVLRANGTVFTDATLGFSDLTGNATVAQGGTNITSYSIGDIIYATAATVLTKLGIGTDEYVLTAEGTGLAYEERMDLTSNQTVASGIKTFAVPPKSSTNADESDELVNFSQLSGLSVSQIYKDSVTAATTTSLTLSGVQNVDIGVTGVSGDRVLVAGQSSNPTNGCYTQDAGAWTRCTDYDAAAEVIRGTTFGVEGGTFNQGKVFIMNSPSVVTLGVDAITFASFPGVNITGGDGISVTAGDISVDFVTDNGFQFTGSQLAHLFNNSMTANSSGLAVNTTSPFNWTALNTWTDARPATLNASSTAVGTLKGYGAVDFDSTVNIDGALSISTVSGAGLTDCDGSSNAIRWDSSTSLFSCGSISGSGSGSGSNGVATTTVKLVTENITNNTYQDDDELKLAVDASSKYNFRFVLFTRSATVPDMKFQVTGPTGATCVYMLQNTEDAISHGTTAGTSNRATACSSSMVMVTAAATDETLEIVGSMTTSVTAGDITLQWAQNTTNATPATVYAGSYLVAYKVGAVPVFTSNWVFNSLGYLTPSSTVGVILPSNATTTGHHVVGNTNPPGPMVTGDLFVGNSATATANFQADGSTFVVQADTSRVGVGTLTPGNLFTVAGIAESSSMWYSSGTGITQILLDSTTANYGRIQNDRTDTWSLAYGSSATNSLGNAVIQWGTNGNATATGALNIGTTAVGTTLGALHGAGDLYVGRNATVTTALTVTGLFQARDSYASTTGRFNIGTSLGGLAANTNLFNTGDLFVGDDATVTGSFSAGGGALLVDNGDGKISVASNSWLYFVNTLKTNIVMNSSGSNYGTIQNDGANFWSLGYKTTNSTVAGTAVIQWGANGNATTTGGLNIGTTIVGTTLGTLHGAGDLFVGDDATVTDSLHVGSLFHAFDSHASTTGSFNIGTTLNTINNSARFGAGDLFVGDDATTTGSFTVDTNTLFVNADTNWVGIGTIDPEGLLEVQGAEGLPAVIYLDADDGDDAADTWFLESEIDNDFTFNQGTTELLELSNLSSYVQIDSPLGMIFQEAGGNRFAIDGNAVFFYDDIELQFGSSLDYSMGYNATTDSFQIVDGAALNSNVRLSILPSGNVGINTTTPNDYKFVVNSTDATTGLFQVATTSNRFVFAIGADGNITLSSSSDTTIAPLITGDNPGRNLTITAGQGGAFLGTGGALNLTGGNGLAGGAVNINSTGFVAGDVNIQNSTLGDVLLADGGGKVGINTTTPAALLTISLDDKTTYPWLVASTTNAQIFAFTPDGTLTFSNHRPGIQFTDDDSGDDDYFIATDNTDNTLSFYTGTKGSAETQALSIDTNARVIHEINTAVSTDPVCWDGSGPSIHADCTSLFKWKANIFDLKLGLETVLELQPRTFNWRRDPTTHELDESKIDPELDLGFIAEEVEAVDPLLASYSLNVETGNKELVGIKIERFVAPLINAVQELFGKFQLLFSWNEELQKRIEKLEAIVEKQQVIISNLQKNGTSN